MTESQGPVVVHAVVDGIAALTAAGGPACVPLPQLRDYATQLSEDPSSDVYVLAPGETGRVLAHPSTTLLLRSQDVDLLPQWLLDEIGGAGQRGDAITALLDAQWRLNLMARRVTLLSCGESPVDDASPDARRRRSQGLLALLETNLGEELRGALLPVAQLLMLSGTLSRAQADTAALDLQRSPGGDEIGTLDVPTAALVGAWGVDGALDALEAEPTAREELQSSRRVADIYLLPLIRRALPVLLGGAHYGDDVLRDQLLQTFGVEPLLRREPVVSVLRVGGQDAAERADMEAIPGLVEGLPADHAPDAVVVSGGLPAETDAVVPEDVPLMLDLSNLDLLGWLCDAAPMEDRGHALASACRRADRVLVRDEAQRDFLLGALAGTQRVNDLVYDDDSSLRSLVAVKDSDSLAAFCTYAVRAADVALEPVEPEPPKVNDLVLAARYLREGGVRQVMSKAAGRVRRLAGAQGGK